MTVTGLLDSLPLWGIFLITLSITFLSMDFGFYAGKRRRRKLPAGQTIRSGPVAAASFSLLAFMLAITFGVVDSRLKDIKHVVLEEANAIRTAFLRADLLSTSDGAEVRKLLQDYVDLRVESGQLDKADKVALAEDKLDGLQSSLWSKAVAVADQNATTRLFVQSLNKVIEVHAKWVTLSINYRLPGAIWLVLYGLAIVAMTMGGYDTGASDSRRVVAVTVAGALVFSVVLALLVSLNRPSPSVTQAAMINLQEDIRTSMRSQP
jgi:hypothetical protein